MNGDKMREILLSEYIFDLLKEVYVGNITDNQGADFILEANKLSHEGYSSRHWYDLTSLNNLEASLTDNYKLSIIAKWRYEGYPKDILDKIF